MLGRLLGDSRQLREARDKPRTEHLQRQPATRRCLKHAACLRQQPVNPVRARQPQTVQPRHRWLIRGRDRGVQEAERARELVAGIAMQQRHALSRRDPPTLRHLTRDCRKIEARQPLVQVIILAI